MSHPRRAGVRWSCALAILASTTVAAAQDARSVQPAAAEPAAGTVQPHARALVARISAAGFESTDKPAEIGAGVIVGTDARWLYIATARHVVAEEFVTGASSEFVAAKSVWVSLYDQWPGDSMPARVVLLDSAYRTGMARTSGRTARDAGTDSAFIARYDLAMLVVRRPTTGLGSAIGTAQLDWLGDASSLAFGDAVQPMGCPRNECWTVPVPADRMIGMLKDALMFQSNFVGPGSSGGALFNGASEIVGLLIEHQPPRVTALPMTQVVQVLRVAGTPVDLRPARFPRAGYRTTFGVTMLSAGGGATRPDAIPGETRWPSARAMFMTRGESPWTVTTSVIHLAPLNTSINALMAGSAYDLEPQRLQRRLQLQPFAEIGLGRAEIRFDSGGYYTAPKSTGGRAAYVPLWRTAEQSGIVLGAGLSVGYLVWPNIRLTATVARWSIDLPANAPGQPGLYFGGGVRWER